MRSKDFVESYFDAWNHGDALGVADHLKPNGTYWDIPDHQTHSREQLIAHLSETFAHEDNHYDLIGEILTAKNSVAFQYMVTSSEQGKKDPDAWYGAEFVTLDGDAAIRIADYYDLSGAASTHPLLSLTSSEAFRHKYAKSGLSGEQTDVYKNRLTELMHSQSIYVTPDLTLPKLAAMVGCSVNHLSQAINSGFGMSFFDYLNMHRIEDAKKMLKQPMNSICPY